MIWYSFIQQAAETPKTRPAYPKILLSVLQTAYVCISRFLTGFFCGCTTYQPKQTSVKGQFLYHSSCKNKMWTHILNYTYALHSDDFILFTSAKVVLDRRPHNTSSKNNAPCVLLLLMPKRPFLNGSCLVGVYFLGFMHSSSSSSVCAATYHQQLRIQTHHIGRWLTSVKFRCKGHVHWFNKLFWSIRTGRILQTRKWLEICKCQRMISPHQCSRSA